MRILDVRYQIKYSDMDDWRTENAPVLAGDDSGYALVEFEKFVRARVINPDPGQESQPVTVVDYRLVSATITAEGVEYISPDVLIQQSMLIGIIEPTDVHGEDSEETQQPKPAA